MIWHAVIKEHRYRGNYIRWLRITDHEIASIDPNTGVVTNSWHLKNLTTVLLDKDDPMKFTMTLEKSATEQGSFFGSSTVSVPFRSYCRSEVVADLYYLKNKDSSRSFDVARARTSCKLLVNYSGIYEVDGSFAVKYSDIHNLERVAGGGVLICVGIQAVPHLYTCPDSQSKFLWETIRNYSRANGEKIKVFKTPFDPLQFEARLQKSLVNVHVGQEWNATRVFEYNHVPVTLRVGEEYIEERTSRGELRHQFLLKRLYEIVLPHEQESKVILRFHSESLEISYSCENRDALVAYICNITFDATRARVALTHSLSSGHLRTLPQRCNIPAEIEVLFLKRLLGIFEKDEPVLTSDNMQTEPARVFELVSAFVENSNPILSAESLAVMQDDISKHSPSIYRFLMFSSKLASLNMTPAIENYLVLCFKCMIRFCTKSADGSSFPINKFVNPLTHLVETCTKRGKTDGKLSAFYAIELAHFLCRIEYANVASVGEMVSANVDNARLLLTEPILTNLVKCLALGELECTRLAAAQFLGYIAVALPLAMSDDQTTYIAYIVSRLMEHHAELTRLAFSVTPSVLENLAVLFYKCVQYRPYRALLQTDALASGAFAFVLQESLFACDSRRFSCRVLIQLWLFSNQTGHEVLKRIFPRGLYEVLTHPELSIEEYDALRTLDLERPGRFGVPGGYLWTIGTQTCQFDDQQGSSWQGGCNFVMFFHMVSEEHRLPDLLWNTTTRGELLESLRDEVSSIRSHVKEDIQWNYVDFSVKYASLSHEIVVGDCFLRLLAPDPQEADPFTFYLDSSTRQVDSTKILEQIKHPRRLFAALFTRYLREEAKGDRNMAVLCLRVMERLYRRHARIIGVFEDLDYLIQYISHTNDGILCERMMYLILTLCRFNRANVARVLAMENEIINISQWLSLSNFAARLPNHMKEKSWIMQADDGKEIGPYNLEQLRTLASSGTITSTSRVRHVNGDGVFMPIESIVSLKYFVLRKHDGSLTPHQFVVVVISFFNILAQPPATMQGTTKNVFPKPRTAEIWKIHPEIVERLTQCTLAGCDDSVTRESLEVLRVLIDSQAVDFEQVLKTGIVYFLFSGSLESIGAIATFLISIEHVQDIGILLGDILPASLIEILRRHEAIKFAEIFSSSSVSPEAVWTHSMREHLQKMVQEHIGPFLSMLEIDPMSHYQYISMPPVLYNETGMWCGGYYLDLLCDLSRFDGWPIHNVEHLLKSTTEKWQALFSKSDVSEGDDVQAACAVIGATEGIPSAKEVRKLYRQSSSAGTVDSKTLERAYFTLLRNSPGASSKSWYDVIVRTHLILFKCHKDALSAIPYEAFPMLLSLLRTSQSAEDMDILVELLHIAVSVSGDNMTSFVENGGVPFLLDILQRFVNDRSVNVLTANQILKILVAISTLPTLHTILLEQKDVFADTIASLLSHESDEHILQSVLQVLSRLAICRDLQILCATRHYRYLLPLLFRLEITAKDNPESALRNVTCKYAARAWSRLAGMLEDPKMCTPPFDDAVHMTKCLFTLPIAQLFVPSNPTQLLRTLNETVQTPLMIWTPSMKEEVEEFCARSDNPLRCEDFVHKELIDEPIVAGVYLRLALADPETPLGDEIGLVLALLASFQGIQPSPEIISLKLQCLAMVVARGSVDSLGKAIVAGDPNQIKMIVQFLMNDELSTMSSIILSRLSQFEAFGQLVCSYGLLEPIFENPTKVFRNEMLLESIVLPYCRYSAMVRFLNTARHILWFLRGMADTAEEPRHRELCVSILSRCIRDISYGKHTAAILGDLLPRGIVIAIEHESVLAFFDDSKYDPETIWNPSMKSLFMKSMEENIPHVSYENINGLFCVGGIFLHVLAEQPQFQVSDPKDFVKQLITQFCEYLNTTPKLLEADTSKIIEFEMISESLELMVKKGYLEFVSAFDIVDYPVRISKALERLYEHRDHRILRTVLVVMKWLVNDTTWNKLFSQRPKIEISLCSLIETPCKLTPLAVAILNIMITTDAMQKRMMDFSVDRFSETFKILTQHEDEESRIACEELEKCVQVISEKQEAAKLARESSKIVIDTSSILLPQSSMSNLNTSPTPPVVESNPLARSPEMIPRNPLDSQPLPNVHAWRCDDETGSEERTSTTEARPPPVPRRLTKPPSAQ